MDEPSFWKLHTLLKPHLKTGSEKPKPGANPKKKHKSGATNGIIPGELRLSAALRHFTDGDPCDIGLSHGIGNSDVYNSVWAVVDAVNKCTSLDIVFPKEPEKQLAIARGFKEKSKAGFHNCCGAIDGILIWIEKPHLRDCDAARCGQTKFFCGRKKKFGWNVQAICDVHGRYLDVEISHPGSTSYYLSFVTSEIGLALEEGLLHPGLCLFGDNAYVSARYMATPYKNVRSGTEDDYNFYHSSTRIKIECSFGMLLNRWGLLRLALSASMGLKKQAATVMCLCKLHNFCINQRLEKNGVNDEVIPPPTVADELEMLSHGSVPLEKNPNGMNDKSPEQLLGSGHHFDDVPRDTRRRMINAELAALNDQRLPRAILHDIVVGIALRRPPPVAWKSRT